MALLSLLPDDGSPGSFHGRANSGGWFVAIGWNGVIVLLLAMIPKVGFFFALPWIAAMFAATSRRLHDMGRSGWLQLAPWLIIAAVEGYLVLTREFETSYQTASDAMVTTMLLAHGASAALLFFTRGDKGPNVYGESVR